MTKKNFNIIFKISWQLLEILTTIGCFDSSKFVQKTLQALSKGFKRGRFHNIHDLF